MHLIEITLKHYRIYIEIVTNPHYEVFQNCATLAQNYITAARLEVRNFAAVEQRH